MDTQAHYLALCGGVGGAKLALGLAHILPPESLTIAVNVGDNFEHLGLPVWPDIDTVMYTLAGLHNPVLGWGRNCETNKVMSELKRLGAPSWFTLGDKDIALHLLRKHLLDQDQTPSEISRTLANTLGIKHTVLPISNQTISTMVTTDQGKLEFQEYFVKHRSEPKIISMDYLGASTAKLTPEIESIIQSDLLTGIIVCPSNPYLSIAPMLAIKGVRSKLAQSNAPTVAVSPIIGGAAIKGPTAKIMSELGAKPSASLIAELYADFVDLTIIDQSDHPLAINQPAITTAQILMNTLEDKKQLAKYCIKAISNLTNT